MTRTGAVHVAQGMRRRITFGARILPIHAVDDHGRLTDEAGLPNHTGKYVFDANADIVTCCATGMLLGAQIFIILSLLLALENADHLSQCRAVLYSYR